MHLLNEFLPTTVFIFNCLLKNNHKNDNYLILSRNGTNCLVLA